MTGAGSRCVAGRPVQLQPLPSHLVEERASTSGKYCAYEISPPHGYQTIISVDAIYGSSAYVEQYSVYQFVAAPVLGGKVILTRSDMIKF